MNGFSYTDTAPQNWESLATASGALFGSTAWLSLLEKSFGCKSVYICDGQQGSAVSVFRAGPFNVGYLGFPVGAVIGDMFSNADPAELFRTTDWPNRPTCMRFPVSSFDRDQEFDLPFQSNPETAIEDLQSWDLGSVSKNLRRDIRKAERSELVIIEALEHAKPDVLFNIYSQTVKRHGGSLRYSSTYFRELVNLARTDSRVRVLVACKEEDVAGFVVTIRHNKTTCYLHGGADPAYRQSSPSDLLLNTAVQRAQQDGSDLFSFMASPTDQPSLVRYKEKWGGVTRDLKTYTLSLRPSYPMFKMAEKVYSLIR